MSPPARDRAFGGITGGPTAGETLVGASGNSDRDKPSDNPSPSGDGGSPPGDPGGNGDDDDFNDDKPNGFGKKKEKRRPGGDPPDDDDDPGNSDGDDHAHPIPDGTDADLIKYADYMRRRRGKEADSIKIHSWPNVKNFRQWKVAFRNQIAADSGIGESALQWILKVEDPDISIE